VGRSANSLPEIQGPIHKSIEWLDHAGMDIIESVSWTCCCDAVLHCSEVAHDTTTLCNMQGNPDEFTRYLQQFGNTICGRHPIGVLLQVLYTHCMCAATEEIAMLAFALKSTS
jgi:predicted class III extradiol MEMO1 family dioxygenase